MRLLITFLVCCSMSGQTLVDHYIYESQIISDGNLYTQPNAMATGAEADAITDTVCVNCSATSIAEVEGSSQYSASVEALSGTAAFRIYLDGMGLTNGTDYNVVIRAKTESGASSSNIYLDFHVGLTVTSSPDRVVFSGDVTQFQDLTFDFTLDDEPNAYIRFNNRDLGNFIWVASVIITEL